jgi:hypothetical protein
LALYIGTDLAAGAGGWRGGGRGGGGAPADAFEEALKVGRGVEVCPGKVCGLGFGFEVTV